MSSIWKSLSFRIWVFSVAIGLSFAIPAIKFYTSMQNELILEHSKSEFEKRAERSVKRNQQNQDSENQQSAPFPNLPKGLPLVGQEIFGCTVRLVAIGHSQSLVTARCHRKMVSQEFSRGGFLTGKVLRRSFED